MAGAGCNDLGFSVGSRLVVMIESQSTWTLNIIIRALMYLIQTYHDFFKRTRQNLYGSKKMDMPKPESKKAATETIRICKDRNVLREYLESKEQEVKALRARLRYI